MPPALSIPARGRLAAYRNRLEQQVRADSAFSQALPVCASGVVARTILKKARASSVVAGRTASEKHIQSVHHMLKAELGFSA